VSSDFSFSTTRYFPWRRFVKYLCSVTLFYPANVSTFPPETVEPSVFLSIFPVVDTVLHADFPFLCSLFNKKIPTQTMSRLCARFLARYEPATSQSRSMFFLTAEKGRRGVPNCILVTAMFPATHSAKISLELKQIPFRGLVHDRSRVQKP